MTDTNNQYFKNHADYKGLTVLSGITLNDLRRMAPVKSVDDEIATDPYYIKQVAKLFNNEHPSDEMVREWAAVIYDVRKRFHFINNNFYALKQNPVHTSYSYHKDKKLGAVVKLQTDIYEIVSKFDGDNVCLFKLSYFPKHLLKHEDGAKLTTPSSLNIFDSANSTSLSLDGIALFRLLGFGQQGLPNLEYCDICSINNEWVWADVVDFQGNDPAVIRSLSFTSKNTPIDERHVAYFEHSNLKRLEKLSGAVSYLSQLSCVQEKNQTTIKANHSLGIIYRDDDVNKVSIETLDDFYPIAFSYDKADGQVQATVADEKIAVVVEKDDNKLTQAQSVRLSAFYDDHRQGLVEGHDFFELDNEFIALLDMNSNRIKYEFPLLREMYKSGLTPNFFYHFNKFATSNSFLYSTTILQSTQLESALVLFKEGDTKGSLDTLVYNANLPPSTKKIIFNNGFLSVNEVNVLVDFLKTNSVDTTNKLLQLSYDLKNTNDCNLYAKYSWLLVVLFYIEVGFTPTKLANFIHNPRDEDVCEVMQESYDLYLRYADTDFFDHRFINDVSKYYYFLFKQAYLIKNTDTHAFYEQHQSRFKTTKLSDENGNQYSFKPMSWVSDVLYSCIDIQEILVEYMSRCAKGDCDIVVICNANQSDIGFLEITRDDNTYLLTQAKLDFDYPVSNDMNLAKLVTQWAKAEGVLIKTNDLQVS